MSELSGSAPSGVGAVALLENNAEWIAKRVGSRVVVKTVVDVDWERPRDYTVRPEQQSRNIDDIFEDPEIDIVIEAMGGIKPAKRVRRHRAEAPQIRRHSE